MNILDAINSHIHDLIDNKRVGADLVKFEELAHQVLTHEGQIQRAFNRLNSPDECSSIHYRISGVTDHDLALLENDNFDLRRQVERLDEAFKDQQVALDSLSVGLDDLEVEVNDLPDEYIIHRGVMEDVDEVIDSKIAALNTGESGELNDYQQDVVREIAEEVANECINNASVSVQIEAY